MSAGRTIVQFHGDNVWRDTQGTIWVRQSESIEMQADAFDRGVSWAVNRRYGDRYENPYRTITERTDRGTS